MNFFGPALAAVPLAVLLTQVREAVARTALAANVAILAFYAVIEAGDLLLESASGVDLPMLTPEFNYGAGAPHPDRDVCRISSQHRRTRGHRMKAW